MVLLHGIHLLITRWRSHTSILFKTTQNMLARYTFFLDASKSTVHLGVLGVFWWLQLKVSQARWSEYHSKIIGCVVMLNLSPYLELFFWVVGNPLRPLKAGVKLICMNLVSQGFFVDAWDSGCLWWDSFIVACFARCSLLTTVFLVTGNEERCGKFKELWNLLSCNRMTLGWPTVTSPTASW